MSVAQEVRLGIEIPRAIYYERPKTITARCATCGMTWNEKNIWDSVWYTEALLRLQSIAFCDCSSPSIKFSDS